MVRGKRNFKWKIIGKGNELSLKRHRRVIRILFSVLDIIPGLSIRIRPETEKRDTMKGGPSHKVVVTERKSRSVLSTRGEGAPETRTHERRTVWRNTDGGNRCESF